MKNSTKRLVSGKQACEEVANSCFFNYCVLYLKDGVERRTAWFRSRDRAREALEIITGKGYQAIIYAD